MKDSLKVIISLVALVAFLGFGVWWTVYKYKDCRAVGHAKTYCVLKLFAD